MLLHVHQWGDREAPAVVCLHGVTAHGERFKQLAEERWASKFRVVAPDLRGHGRSRWEPPWDLATHVADLIQTVDELGLDRPAWVGHSFGGRLIVELAARHPDRIRRAVLLDPAIQILPHVAEQVAATELREPIWDSIDAHLAEREDIDSIDRQRALADLELHFDRLPDGRVRRRAAAAAAIAIYGELASEPPPPTVLTMPTLLLYAPAYGLVRDEHLGYGSESLAVGGMHVVMWSAFDETAEAVEEFLSA
jgi:lipase